MSPNGEREEIKAANLPMRRSEIETQFVNFSFLFILHVLQISAFILILFLISASKPNNFFRLREGNRCNVPYKNIEIYHKRKEN